MLRYKSTHGRVCFLLLERKVGVFGYKRGYISVCTLAVILRTRKFLQVLTISPRICRACRPTPCPHSACKRDAKHLRLPKLGGAGGSPLILPLAAKSRSPSRAHGRGGYAPSPGLWCSAGRTGSGGEPTPSHSRAQGRAPCFGLPTNAGGEKKNKISKSCWTRPSRVGSLRLLGTRPSGRVLTIEWRCPQRACHTRPPRVY